VSVTGYQEVQGIHCGSGRRREKEIGCQWEPVGDSRNGQEWTGEVVMEWSDSDGMKWDGMIVEWKGREESDQS